jgi:D-glycero-beta-D-manno-heptose 1-phosphate adenylyltransferase
MSIIKSPDEIVTIRESFRKDKKKVVFTNGVFDLIHAGHVDYLTKAKASGDLLIVGLNSDASVRRIKGEFRPIIPESQRAFVLSNLKPVDYVVIFGEDTPAVLIEKIIPDILIKGADWSLDNIVGKDIVLKNGGEVKTIEFENFQSTSNIIQTILERYGT